MNSKCGDGICRIHLPLNDKSAESKAENMNCGFDMLREEMFPSFELGVMQGSLE
jgi:hypothetical protein